MIKHFSLRLRNTLHVAMTIKRGYGLHSARKLHSRKKRKSMSGKGCMSVKGLRTKRNNQKGGLFFLAGLIPLAIAAAKAAAIPLAISAAKTLATTGLSALAGHLMKQKGSGYSLPEIIQKMQISKKDLPRTALQTIKRAEEVINNAKQDNKYKVALEVGKALRPIFEPIVLKKLREHGIMLGSGIKLAGGSFEHELASRVVSGQTPGLVGSGMGIPGALPTVSNLNRLKEQVKHIEEVHRRWNALP